MVDKFETINGVVSAIVSPDYREFRIPDIEWSYVSD